MTALCDYKKIYTVYENKPNTFWLSRNPDKTAHYLTIRPRYVEERLGKVRAKGTIDNGGRNVVEFSTADMDIGFEVTNQFTERIAVDMYQGNSGSLEKVADYALRPGETYFFDNRNKIDKRRFSLKKKVGAGGEPITFGSSTLDENNVYLFKVYHLNQSEWPSKVLLHMDEEIKVPIKNGGGCPYTAGRLGSPSFGESKSLSPPARASALPSLRSAALPAGAMYTVKPKAESYVAEQQLSGLNTEKLQTVVLDLNMRDVTNITFVTVLRD
ncbi:Hypothetical protein POVN_LOCUS88 [uncultured virus]|nr:Hypothetical protein POVN_LOCUS88 [uncultured virus]